MLSGQEVKNGSAQRVTETSFIYQSAWTGGLRETKNIGPDAETDMESEMHFVENTGYILKKKNKGRGVRREHRRCPWRTIPPTSCPGGEGAHVHEGGVDVVAALAVEGDEEGQAAVGGQDVHAAVLLVVPGQERDAAVLHAQGRRHHVQGLEDRGHTLGKRTHLRPRETYVSCS